MCTSRQVDLFTTFILLCPLETLSNLPKDFLFHLQTAVSCYKKKNSITRFIYTTCELVISVDVQIFQSQRVMHYSSTMIPEFRCRTKICAFMFSPFSHEQRTIDNRLSCCQHSFICIKNVIIRYIYMFVWPSITALNQIKSKIFSQNTKQYLPCITSRRYCEGQKQFCQDGSQLKCM